MGDYTVDGPWLEKRVEEVLANLRRIKEMLKEGKREDEEGSLISQMNKLKIELSLLKEILKHATDADKKKGGEND